MSSAGTPNGSAEASSKKSLGKEGTGRSIILTDERAAILGSSVLINLEKSTHMR